MRTWPALVLVLPLAAAAQTPAFEDSYRGRDRGDAVQVQFPQYPRPADYLPFQVSPTTPFASFVDANSISVGSGDLVRYSLISKSADGGLNVSFEGMRCTDGQYRVYAYGRPDGTWSEARNSRWEPIPADTRNAQRKVLYTDFFCPPSGAIATAGEGVQALKRGGNPRSSTGF